MPATVDDIQLEPPVGTCYFKSYSTTFQSSEHYFEFSITITFYVYVTLAKPTDPDFTDNGGKVYIIAVYRGSASITTPLHFHFGFDDQSGLLSLVNQFPIPGSEDVDGNKRLYNIDYSQTMSMYKNGGNDPYSFPARYNHSFILEGYSQSKYKPGSWSLIYEFDDSYDFPDVNGLQVFETNSLAIANCNIFCGISLDGVDLIEAAEKVYSLDFSADTMSGAIVG
ncbi:hypothetical protein APHAL10511_003076 [Amanita phalloides]|nr:hypothetical protein APHAL10511_003076 [Amanita phalloides]